MLYSTWTGQSNTADMVIISVSPPAEGQEVWGSLHQALSAPLSAAPVTSTPSLQSQSYAVTQFPEKSFLWLNTGELALGDVRTWCVKTHKWPKILAAALHCLPASPPSSHLRHRLLEYLKESDTSRSSLVSKASTDLQCSSLQDLQLRTLSAESKHEKTPHPYHLFMAQGLDCP